jgi:hypothetical protein
MVLPPAALAGDKAPSAPEREFAGLLNQERAARGLSAVQISPDLTEVAGDYVAENVQQGGTTHDRDAPFTARTRQAGCSGWSGPVLAEGYPTPAELLRGWLDSPDHSPVLLGADNTHVGVGLEGEQAVAFVLRCVAPGANPFAPSGRVAEPLALAPAKLKAQGRMLSTRVRVRAGQGTLRLVARSRGTVVRSRPVAVAKRGRPYLLALRVRRAGRWAISLEADGRTARRFSVRVPARR